MLRTARLTALALLTTTAACATAGRQVNVRSVASSDDDMPRPMHFAATKHPAEAYGYAPAPTPRPNAVANAALIFAAAAAGGAAAIQPPALVHRTVVCVGGICSIY